jgi:hypothetical protein
MQNDYFRTYSRFGHVIVYTFVKQLETVGYKVWIDKIGKIQVSIYSRDRGLEGIPVLFFEGRQCFAIYENEEGMKNDYQEGVKWYRKAAEQGNEMP